MNINEEKEKHHGTSSSTRKSAPPSLRAHTPSSQAVARRLQDRIVREPARAALVFIAARFSGDAPAVDERVLRARYSAVEAWPADAQLGLLVLGWVLGPGFAIPKFQQAVNVLEPDFARAARAIGPGGTDPTLIALGGVIRRALRNGAVVVRWDLNPDILYWPLDLSSCAGATL